MKALCRDGNTAMALTDMRDIGRYVARITVNPQTLNKIVFAHGEMWTQNRIWDLLQSVSGEEVPKEYVGYLLYMYSWGIRGDNTPDRAKYLGYLDDKELYPDISALKFEDYV
ncbi:hypothetical protein G7Y89_g9876 [Cudoniella acicularis]|uniref:Uncharacterized protein n=1 Tax=Cudoniella acicularis TaxID=354080 RepID=A0A8H4RDU4_9HELO|nr:hypothetical protein G7Y89_g9876 [Cudoniella acicularis]